MKGLEVSNAFLKIFEERITLHKNLPENLHVDEGK